MDRGFETSLDEAVERRADDALGFLEGLVGAASTVGHEPPAQRRVAAELERLGFDVAAVEIPADIAEDPASGVPQMAYDGRANVVGRLAGGPGPSLLINGHVDVVPPSEPDLWASQPFTAVRRNGWLFGRGAADMKGGLAMATLAIDALRTVDPGAPAGSLSFVSVLEEECTGNGTLATGRAGVLADAVILPEPTDLRVLVAGVAILWIEIEVTGSGAHAESADRAGNPVDSLVTVMAALREFERAMNAEVAEPALADVAHPYNVNFGTVGAGDWPSSVPARAHLGVRIGHPSSWTAAETERRVRASIAAAVEGDATLRDHPPVVRSTGFRAEGYAIDPEHPLVTRLCEAHVSALGRPAATVALGSTTDARYYLNCFDTPAVCYGPRSRNIHGVDEAVDLTSIVDGAKTLARFMAAWFVRPDVGGAP